MGRPLFQVLHNMIPIWIAVLKLLKKAPKSLPSMKMAADRNANLFVNAIRSCGGVIDTDSFRYSYENRKVAMRLRCGGSVPATESFRVVINNELALLQSPTSDSEEDSVNSTEYSTAPSTLGSPSDRTLDGVIATDFDPQMHQEMMTINRDDNQSFLEHRNSDLIHDPSMQTEKSSDLHVRIPVTSHLIIPGNTTKQSHPRSSRKPRSSKLNNRSRVSTFPSNKLAPSSAHILQRSNPLPTFSHDPLADFVASITDMIVANNLSAYQDLEDLFRCYLDINAPKHHGIITLAFLEAMARLDHTTSA